MVPAAGYGHDIDVLFMDRGYKLFIFILIYFYNMYFRGLAVDPSSIMCSQFTVASAWFRERQHGWRDCVLGCRGMIERIFALYKVHKLKVNRHATTHCMYALHRVSKTILLFYFFFLFGMY